MFDFLKNLFGDRNERALKELWPLVDEINEYAEEYESLTDDELRGKTDEFRQLIRERVADIEARQEEVRTLLRGRAVQPADVEVNVGGDGQAASARVELSGAERQELHDEFDELEEEWLAVVEDTLSEVLTQAFAVMKETCRRMVGKEWEAGGSRIKWEMVPYDVQLLGGIVLHRGQIAEMKTGEGKTLVATLPVYLNALVGRGVHVITVNPYLAERDSEWMAPLFEFHGLSVDCIDRYQPHSQGRRAAYRADITYGTNNEFGFDYLRDNSFVVDANQLVQREQHYAIVDEVDSVLIDEARTPLIISGPVPESEDRGRFEELKPIVEKVVYAQKKLVAELVSEAEEHLAAAERARQEGERREASRLEDAAGLALFRASRGFPKNKKYMKLLQEPGIGQLVQKTESFYLQENAKRMPEADEALYFALEEKQHSIELTDKGRDFIASRGEDRDLFVLPDVGEGVVQIDREYEEKIAARRAELENDESLSEEKRQNKIENDTRVLRNEWEEAKRELYNLYSERAARLHAVEQLLKAYTMFEKDTEYIVQEGKVNIVDEHTGRVMPGRRYSDGLHQAIEAKENVKVQAATQTYATITLQNFFRMYDKLAGMTGTAMTEAEEFYKIYELDSLAIPTNEPVRRDDKEDLVFKTKREKYNAVLETIAEYNETGQPVLVGTTSVEVSETLSRMLKRQGIRHSVLNAKPERVEQESQVVANAGKQGAVTLATNMAGRGTDIKLGEGVRELGGLAILGTERHDSRRIDLQLRGRAGRQGDPGESQFYISLEDNLMRLFMSDRVSKVMDRLGVEEGEVITHPWVSKSIERAQKKVEQNNFAIRKRQLEYDDVLNAQRAVIYDRRRHALKGDRLHSDLLDMLEDLIQTIVETHYGNGDFDELREEILRKLAFDVELDRERFVMLGEDGTIDHLYEKAVEYYNDKRDALAGPFHQSIRRIVEDGERDKQPERIVVDFTDGQRVLRAVASVSEALETEGQEINDALERVAVLSHIDERWTEHLRKLDELREGIGLRAFGQKDPLLEYKMEAYKLFTELIEQIDEAVVSFAFRAGPLVEAAQHGEGAGPKRRLDPRRAQMQHDAAQPDYGVKAGAGSNGGGEQQGGPESDPSTESQPVVVEDEPGRNDYVTIQNPSTGDTEKLKYKYAQKKINKGWSLISVEA